MENKELHDLVKHIAEALHDEWQYDEKQGRNSEDGTLYRYAYITRQSDNASIIFNLDYIHNNRLSIHGSYPNVYRRSDELTPTITVSPLRDVQAIVNSVRRRFLPQYESLYRILLDRQKEVENYQAVKLKVGNRLEEIPGVRKSSYSSDMYHFSTDATRNEYGEFRIDNEDSISMQIRSINPDLVEKILRLILTE